MVLEKIKDIQKYLKTQRANFKSIGFVPTMGALHEGHISLIKMAKIENDICVCSIFVNPAQFNDPEDLKKYPRTVEKDIEMLKKAGNDVLFLPDEKEIYPERTQQEQRENKFDFGYLEQIMEGKSRPGHFNGVAKVVSRLLNIIQPDKFYLGQKDYQQFLIVKKLLEQINLKTKLEMCGIVREKSGLAMSSRNARLSDEELSAATIISQTLFFVQYNAGKISIEELKKEAIKKIKSIPFGQLDYFEICDAETLYPVLQWDESKKIIALTAVKLGNIRLIDNAFLFE